MAVQRLHLGRLRYQHVPDELPGHQEAVQMLSSSRRGGGPLLPLLLQPLRDGGRVRDVGVPLRRRVSQTERRGSRTAQHLRGPIQWQY